MSDSSPVRPAPRLENLAEPAPSPTVPAIETRLIRPRDILMVAPTMFFADYGCHVRILEEAVTLRALGHGLRVLAYPNGRDVAGLSVRRCPGVPFNYRIVVGSSRHKLYLDAMLALTGLHEVLVRPPELIHAHLHEGALLGKGFGLVRRAPLIFDFQGSLTSEMVDHHFLRRDSILYRPLRWLEEQIDNWPAAIITSSHHAASLLVREFNCPHDKVFAVPDCVNTETFRPPEGPEDAAQALALRRSLGIPDDRILVVYLGLLAEYQGTGLLLQAAQQVLQQRQDVHFLVMGYPNEELYTQQAEALGITPWCTFTGRLPYDQAPQYLRLGDIAVAPKRSATEGSGKLLNYMACGLPTVAFNSSVSREYLGDWGVYAHDDSAAGFAGALFELLRTPHEWPILGAALRRRSQERFSWEQAGRLMSEIYDLVCE
ncbi:MAG TPA: glycosyltransferase family 4 protein [Ardenticatenaceae bacterium]|nr:glycosyltransferase family 4 protein [Ardenticatenaceae bacterium]